MSTPLAPTEMAFFSMLARCSSLAAAAREMGVSPPAVTKRLAQMEARLGVQLLTRTTRRMHLTEEGEIYLMHARRILADIEDMERHVSRARQEPKGLLRVNATLGFGRNHVAPLLSRFRRRYPEVDVQLQLTVAPLPLTEDAFDVCVRFGEPPEARVIARPIAANRRLLCAAPAYLAKHGEPLQPADLARHVCIDIRHGSETHGVWRLRQGKREHAVKVDVHMSTNDGEIAVDWALDGHGIILRAEWDIAEHLAAGRLRQVLGRYRTPPADIYAVYSPQHQYAGRVIAFVDFLREAFANARGPLHAPPARPSEAG
ncbi:LysR family transcriptional regulator [Bordetella genomosp. 10]|uniref:LysR family transcriptional regulator n=1 Tax=Bordetella genomosp. 10 TaxID=1416804 RepID=A0A261SAN3_9BORD|nr:LysR family transcriptional regulator [Bordetella genomosp. 10]OZI34459.1 LysR family transcriptional regulator [Bordetella genomosp. 10]